MKLKSGTQTKRRLFVLKAKVVPFETCFFVAVRQNFYFKGICNHCNILVTKAVTRRLLGQHPLCDWYIFFTFINFIIYYIFILFSNHRKLSCHVQVQCTVKLGRVQLTTCQLTLTHNYRLFCTFSPCAKKSNPPPKKNPTPQKLNLSDFFLDLI